MKITIGSTNIGTAAEKMYTVELSKIYVEDPTVFYNLKDPVKRSEYIQELNRIKAGLVVRSYHVDVSTFVGGELGELLAYRDKITEVEVGYVFVDQIGFLRHFPNVEKVHLQCPVKDISALRYLGRLKQLRIERAEARTRMDVLGELKSLESVYLDPWCRGAESLFSLHHLSIVSVQKFPYPTLEGMAGFTGLRHLWLNSGRLEDLTGIPASVETVELSNLRKLASLQGLSVCSELQKLILTKCRSLHSLEGLQHCRRLRQLSTDRIGPLEHLGPLHPLQELEHLVLIDGTIKGPVPVDPLYHLPNLRTLIIPKFSGVDPARVLETAPQCEVDLAEE